MEIQPLCRGGSRTTLTNFFYPLRALWCFCIKTLSPTANLLSFKINNDHVIRPFNGVKAERKVHFLIQCKNQDRRPRHLPPILISSDDTTQEPATLSQPIARWARPSEARNAIGVGIFRNSLPPLDNGYHFEELPTNLLIAGQVAGEGVRIRAGFRS